MTGVVRLFGDAVCAVAGSVPAERPTSWIAPGSSGYLPVPCYVLRSEGSALLIDTGLAAHWPCIRAGLDDLLADCPDRALIMTRREPDAISSLPAIVQRYGLRSVYCGGVISPLDFFERVERASTVSSLQAIARSDVAWVQPGAVVRVGTLELEVLRTTLRVLPKNHFYETRSRTLFASDTWGMVAQASPGPLERVGADDPRLSAEAIARHLRHRFDWLVAVDPGPMQQELAELASRGIERICSSYGAVIEGASAVAATLARTYDALAALSGEVRRERVEGYLSRG